MGYLFFLGDSAASGQHLLQCGHAVQGQVHLQLEHGARVHQEHVQHPAAAKDACALLSNLYFYPRISLCKIEPRRSTGMVHSPGMGKLWEKLEIDEFFAFVLPFKPPLLL